MGTRKELGHIIDQNSSAAELGIKEGEERFRSLFENSSDAVLLSTPDGTIEAANPAACLLFGRSIEEICGSAGFGLRADRQIAAADRALSWRAFL